MKIKILMPYFGKLPDLFPIWLDSCKKNLGMEWLILTDIPCPKVQMPDNVKWIKTAFKDVEDRAKATLGEYCRIRSAYKVCDFRPAFGLIFADHLKDTQWWGYGDMDVVYGDLTPVINICANSDVKRLYSRGHLSLIRNTDEMNMLFMRSAEVGPGHREVFSRDLHVGFDERAGFHQICEHAIKDQYYDELDMADILWSKRNFHLTKHPNHSGQIFTYRNGRVFQEFKVGAEINRKEFIYIHIQKRPIYLNNCENFDEVAICPMGVFSIKGDADIFRGILLQKEPFLQWTTRFTRTQSKRIRKWSGYFVAKMIDAMHRLKCLN